MIASLTELLAGVAVFTTLIMLLVALVLLARRVLVPVGTVKVLVNGRKELVGAPGDRLHHVLLQGGVPIPSACGGAGTCGLCVVHVASGGGLPLALEADRFTRREIAQGARLACQVALKGDLEVQVPEEILDVRRVRTRVTSTRQVATFMKEIVLAVEDGEVFAFRAGSYVQVTCPPYCVRYRDLEVPERYRPEWERLDLLRHVASTDVETTRAYSLANHPGEPAVVMLVVRLATPPPGAAADVKPGIVSSWLFALQPGDSVTVAGPYGHFLVEETQRELVFVGGGAGMAPMRSHLLDQLEQRRATQRITFWYGARSRKDLFYTETFDELARRHGNFTWEVALSEPLPEDDWEGPTGFIHEHLDRAFLQTHPAPDTCAYYLCGPPLMVRAVTNLLLGHGVRPEDIHADDFGG
jgi:Na+-transporting NADH:ubiquinone oxidoreductase subunit F